jgi:hypothetical protein
MFYNSIFAERSVVLTIFGKSNFLNVVYVNAVKMKMYKTNKPLTYNGLIFQFCGADGTRTRDPRRDRPIF